MREGSTLGSHGEWIDTALNRTGGDGCGLLVAYSQSRKDARLTARKVPLGQNKAVSCRRQAFIGKGG